MQLSLQGSFLPSVPRCCSVITDILKKQRKEIARGRELFLLGNQCWGWMVGRIWQQEGKWLLRSDRQGSKCVWSCVWTGFGICLSTEERLFMALSWLWSVGQSCPCSHCCWKPAGPKGAISGCSGVGIWSGLHRQGSLVQKD